MNKELTRDSKFLSLILRHKPEVIGVKLDENGWLDVEVLTSRSYTHTKKHAFTIDSLEEIVATNNKKRFEFNEDHSKIRACQGHSLDIDLDLKSQKPPIALYHGTATRFLNSIYDQGLIAKGRQHVHLSTDKDTAVNVGKRHGRPLVIKIDSGEMYKDGFEFYLSNNGVWLTEKVPTKYLRIT